MRAPVLTAVLILSFADLPVAVAAGPGTTPAAAAGSASAPTAAAPSGNVPQADALFRAGRAALARGDLVTACARFRESQRLDPESGTLLNLAVCEERSGKLATALAHLHDVRERLPANDFRMAYVQRLIQTLAPRVPQLTLKLRAGAAKGTTVTRNGVQVQALGMPLPMDPGSYVYVVHAPGHADASVTVTLRDGDKRTLLLAPGPTLKTQAPASKSAPDNTSGGWSAHQRLIGLLVGGAGVLGVGLGTYYGLEAKATYNDAASKSHCPSGPTSCDSYGVTHGQTAHDQATVSTVAFIAGGALVAAGAALYFTAPSGTRAEVAPMVGRRTAGLSLQGVW